MCESIHSTRIERLSKRQKYYFLVSGFWWFWFVRLIGCSKFAGERRSKSKLVYKNVVMYTIVLLARGCRLLLVSTPLIQDAIFLFIPCIEIVPLCLQSSSRSRSNSFFYRRSIREKKCYTDNNRRPLNPRSAPDIIIIKSLDGFRSTLRPVSNVALLPC